MNFPRLEQRIRDKWMDSQPISDSPSTADILAILEEEIEFTRSDITRAERQRLSALDMAIRHAETHPDVDLRNPDRVTKTAELFRRFLSGGPWPTM